MVSGKQREQDQLARTQALLEFSKQLQVLINKIHATENISQIMLDLSHEICQLFQADRLTLYVLNKEKALLVSKVKLGINTEKDLILPLDQTSIAGYVALSKETVRIQNVYDQHELKQIDAQLRFCDKVDSLTHYKTRQMLAAPLIAPGKSEVIGVLQLINHRSEAQFSEAVEDSLGVLASTLAQAFAQRLKNHAALSRRYDALVRFGVLAAPELELAMRWAQRKNLELEQVLAQDFQIPLAAIGQALGKHWNLPYQAFVPHRWPDKELLLKLDKAACEKHHWLPWEADRTMLVVVSTDPENRFSAEDIKKAFPFASVLYRCTTRPEFAQMLAQCFSTNK